ncbi:hypothetical protein [Pimelobacter simplex]|uniref:hypothetical protein n=1 Tax=Nocardioides simplex TaxID=2045 RepID=UPI0019316C08|nr:hypothetical protein [Pimelobacter simplex]
MLETKDYFESWLADAVAFGPVGRWSVEERIDQFRAAQYYLHRMYEKPVAFKQRRPIGRDRRLDAERRLGSVR